MSVLNKLAEFVGKYLTYIVFAVVVAAFFFPQGFTWAASQTVLLLWLRRAVYHHAVSRIRFNCWV